MATLPLKKYYESFIKNEIKGMKREPVLKRLGNLLACHVIAKDTPEVVHVRYFSCDEQYNPRMDRWIGTIAVKFKNGIVIDSAVSVPKDKE
ncbi:hypothetical protein ABWK22_02445 [Gottfriedia acidiceleris]|uniref:hypothetical protein n=1 Tax=Gottfriedia acidiceleris TaxID=371036 RepID=UPI00339248E8